LRLGAVKGVKGPLHELVVHSWPVVGQGEEEPLLVGAHPERQLSGSGLGRVADDVQQRLADLPPIDSLGGYLGIDLDTEHCLHSTPDPPAAHATMPSQREAPSDVRW
jgi:hypothetical protein